MPVSRLLTHESISTGDSSRARARLTAFASGRAPLALGAVALATTLTLIGAPAAEALRLF